jgi:hypothetical protein
MSETSEMDERPSIVTYTTCSACRRVVEVGHVNTTGRCVLCAGVAAVDLALLMPGAAWLADDAAPTETPSGAAAEAIAETEEPVTP